MTRFLDRLACRVGVWAIKRLFTPCREFQPEDIHSIHCLGCDAARLIRLMESRQ